MPVSKLNVIIRKKQTKRELAAYLYASCLYPPVTIFFKAIKNEHFLTWPGLNVNLILNHLQKSIYTYQDWLNTKKQGLKSTKLKQSNNKTIAAQDDTDYFPSSLIPNIKTNDVCYAIFDLAVVTAGYMDFTGSFPKTSS